MIVIRMQAGPLETNAYLVKADHAPDGLIVDPGGEGERIAERCRREGLQPGYIVNTHGHADHVGGNAALKAAFPDAELCIGRGDADRLTDPSENLSAVFPPEAESPPPDRLLEEDQVLHCGPLSFRVLETPGHTPGGISLLTDGESPPQLFCGDLVFRDGVGRVDLPGGSRERLEESIRRKVLPLPDETVVRPGHGPKTTVGRERRRNPFFP